jgi:hypothetical protein
LNKVRVFNANVHPLKELFKGNEVSIAPQDYWRDEKGNIKIMDIYEANDYRGQYSPVPFDGSGKMLNDPRYFKMLRLEPVSDAEEVRAAAPQFKCMAKECKHTASSAEELETHAKKDHANMERLVLPEEDEKKKKK